MSDIGNTDLDHRGVYANPRYINDMQPVTRFHPSELPADPEAIRRFPKHLIDPNHYTESPSGDANIEHRLRHAAEVFKENAHKWGGMEGLRAALGLGHNTDSDTEEVEAALGDGIVPELPESAGEPIAPGVEVESEAGADADTGSTAGADSGQIEQTQATGDQPLEAPSAGTEEPPAGDQGAPADQPPAEGAGAENAPA